MSEIMNVPELFGCDVFNEATMRQRLKPEALVGALACAAGLIPENVPISLAELTGEFAWEKVRKTDVCLLL